MKKILMEIYIDGSCKGNPGEGGWGLYAEVDKLPFQMSYGFEEETTNNRMELTSLLKALKFIQKYENTESKYKYIIYSDSSYCVNTINDWIYKWAENNWDEGERKNNDLLKQIYAIITEPTFPKFSVIKVSGHTGVRGNEIADALACRNQTKIQKIFDLQQ